MNLGVFVAFVFSTFISSSFSNPHPRKGELIEAVILKQTQGNYEAAINIFAEIGKLARNHTLSLSKAEQKICFDIYHYRRVQLLKVLVDSEGFLNQEVVKTIMTLFSTFEEIARDLSNNANQNEADIYNVFTAKVHADKHHFESWYTGEFGHVPSMKQSFEKYYEIIPPLRNMLSADEVTLLDTILGYGEIKKAFDTFTRNFDMLPCLLAKSGLASGRNASSASNPDLVPLTNFVDKYCESEPHDIVSQFRHKRRQ